MAQFQLKLLTPILGKDVGVFNFLQTPISEFYKQESREINTLEQKNSYCYSYNEKLSLHKNGQKDLSFSLNRNVWIDDILTINPFVSSIHNGTQILLIDKYGNQFLFTVKNIDYQIGSHNITYNYTCQDSFTYQLIRQQDGYTIENDSKSEDFIGAKDINWWVLNKIKPECHISYKYIPLFTGIYKSKEDKIYTFSSEEEIKEVDKIIKPIYSKEKYPEYYEKIPFSVSGGNASSALISLGESIGLSLNTFEYNIPGTNQFLIYFWYTPEKNEEISGLKYSPNTNIQSFGFSHAGDSLTTVLNVESNTYEDEVVSLIPEIPAFFSNIFDSKEWESTSYKEGLFNSICTGKEYKYSDLYNISDFWIDNNEEWIKRENINDLLWDEKLSNLKESFYTKDFIYLKISNQNFKENSNSIDLFKFPLYYNKVSLETNDEESVLYINQERITPKTSNMYLVYFDKRIEYDVEGEKISLIEKPLNSTANFIPDNFLGSAQPLFLKIPYDSSEGQSFTLTNISLVLNFYRDTTNEELEFAKIADTCPWLENKLIDFSYFLDQNIISREEFNTLKNNLSNDLRIINGKIMFYSKAYYQALQEKTKALADITNTLDSLSAAFHSDVISKYADKGMIDDIKDFNDKYNLMTSQYFGTKDKTQILNYGELLSEYGNKYHSARQRFLKNIYNFKKYFESPFYLLGENATLSTRTFTFLNDSNSLNQYYISFDKQTPVYINSKFNLYDQKTKKPFVKIYDSTNNSIVDVVDGTNFNNFYIANIKEGDMRECEKNEFYDYKKEYFEQETNTEPIGIRDIVSKYINNEENKCGSWTYHITPVKTKRSELLSRSEILDLAETISLEGWRRIFTASSYEINTQILNAELLNDEIKQSILDFYVMNFPIQSLDYEKKEEDNIETKTVKFVTPGNEHLYYRQVVSSPGWGTAAGWVGGISSSEWIGAIAGGVGAISGTFIGTWGGGAGMIAGGTAGATAGAGFGIYSGIKIGQLIRDAVWKYSGTTLRTEGHNTKDISCKTTYASIYDKYWYEEGEVSYLNYIQNTSSYDNFSKIKEPTLKDYIDCYAFTYSNLSTGWKTEGEIEILVPAEEKNESISFKDGYLQFLNTEDFITNKFNYYILFQKKGDEDNLIFNNTATLPIPPKIKKSIYYPIFCSVAPLEISAIEMQNNVAEGIVSFLKRGGFSDITPPESNYLFTGFYKSESDSEPVAVSFYILREEDFETKKVTEYAEYQGYLMFDEMTQQINPLQIEGLVKGLYCIADKDSNYKKATAFNENSSYYIKNEDVYEKVYTIEQMKKNISESFYYFDSDTYEIQELGSKDKYYLPVYLCSNSEDGFKQIKYPKLVEFIPITEGATITIEYEGNTYISDYKYDPGTPGILSAKTNGEFWFLYKDSQNTALQEKTAVIAAELTSYWDQAYSASKYCEFFIPEKWIPASGGKNNFFFADLFTVTEIDKIEEKGETYSVIQVSSDSKFLPKIEKISNTKKYNLVHKTIAMQKTTNPEILAVESENYKTAENIVQNNKAWEQTLLSLGENASDWSLLESGRTDYYYVSEEGHPGILWQDVLNQTGLNYSMYQNFSGLYWMTYKILKNNYINNGTLKTYFDLQERKNDLWNSIYQRFPGIILENKYSYADATTSEDLYVMAKNAFKDMSNPERKYNITIIDSKNIQGYSGQEVKIGDGIQIDAEDYYEEYDDIKKTLSQFLFISDISYDLRKDDDIQLIVNNIKYQDKLIQRLVKLIK